MIILLLQRFGRIFLLGTSLLVTLLISRLYGVETIGEYNLFMTNITLMTTLITFGTNQSMLGYFDESSLGTMFNINIKLYLGVFITSIIVLFLGNFFFKLDSSLILCLILCAGLSSFSQIIKNTQIIINKVHVFYVFDLVLYFLIIATISLFYLLKLKLSIITIISLPYLVFGIYIVQKSIPYINYRSLIKSKIDKIYFKDSLKTLMATLVLMLSYKANVYLIEWQCGTKQLGFYAISNVLVDGIVLLLTSMMLPDFNLIKKLNFKFLKKYLFKYLMFSMGALVCVIIVGSTILSLIYNIEEDQLLPILKYLGFVIPLLTFLKIFQNIFILNKRMNFYLYVSVLLLISICVFNLVFKGGISMIICNYIVSLIIALIFAIVLFCKNRSSFINE